MGFADGIGMVITSNQSDEVEIYASGTICKIKSCRFRAEAAEQETKFVLFTKRRKQKNIQICIDSHTARCQPSLKYLGVTFDLVLDPM